MRNRLISHIYTDESHVRQLADIFWLTMRN